MSFLIRDPKADLRLHIERLPDDLNITLALGERPDFVLSFKYSDFTVFSRCRPWALEAGKVVILDRFGDSSIAYQGAGRELGEKLVARLNRLATADLKPGLTVLVDVPVKVGQGRKGSGVLDRLERERVEFHERVREGYIRVARRAPGRLKVVDGTLPADELERLVFRHVEQLLKRKGILKE